jgi:hypothetical protein
LPGFFFDLVFFALLREYPRMAPRGVTAVSPNHTDPNVAAELLLLRIVLRNAVKNRLLRWILGHVTPPRNSRSIAFTGSQSQHFVSLNLWAMSVLRDNRTTPTVVDTRRDQIDVLMDSVGTHQSACGPNKRDNTGRGKPNGSVAHEHVIVFDAERPIRRKAKFKSGADRSTPLAFGRSGTYVTADGGDSFVNIARYSGAALDVEEDVVPGITNLPRE